MPGVHHTPGKATDLGPVIFVVVMNVVIQFADQSISNLFEMLIWDSFSWNGLSDDHHAISGGEGGIQVGFRLRSGQAC